MEYDGSQALLAAGLHRYELAPLQPGSGGPSAPRLVLHGAAPLDWRRLLRDNAEQVLAAPTVQFELREAARPPALPPSLSALAANARGRGQPQPEEGQPRPQQPQPEGPLPASEPAQQQPQQPQQPRQQARQSPQPAALASPLPPPSPPPPPQQQQQQQRTSGIPQVMVQLDAAPASPRPPPEAPAPASPTKQQLQQLAESVELGSSAVMPEAPQPRSGVSSSGGSGGSGDTSSGSSRAASGGGDGAPAAAAPAPPAAAAASPGAEVGGELQRFASSIQGQIEGLARSVQELRLERERLRSSLSGLPSGQPGGQEQQQEPGSEQEQQQGKVQGQKSDQRQQQQAEQLELAAEPQASLSPASQRQGHPGQPSRAVLQQLHSSGLPQQLPPDVLEPLQRAALAFRAASPRRGARRCLAPCQEACLPSAALHLPCTCPAPHAPVLHLPGTYRAATIGCATHPPHELARGQHGGLQQGS